MTDVNYLPSIKAHSKEEMTVQCNFCHIDFKNNSKGFYRRKLNFCCDEHRVKYFYDALICEYCNKKFLRLKSFPRNKHTFCCRRCFDLSRRKRIYFWCLNCQNIDYYLESQVRHSKGLGKYCSQKCKGIYYRSNPNKTPRFQGGTLTKQGYRKIGNRLEHRLIMEAHLGRNLKPDEDIHHIDGDRSNNSVSNLMIIGHAAHTRLHHNERKGEDNGERFDKT